MDKKDAALVAAGITIVVLAANLHDNRKKTLRLAKASAKLRGWAEIAQSMITEVWTLHPELIDEVSEGTRTNIEFFNLMTKEDLL